MDYSKVMRGGAWAKASDLKEGQKAKIVDECTPIVSQFKNEKGEPKTQDVAKVRFEGLEGPFNVSLNRATLKGLAAAFGAESKEWIGKTLTVHTERTTVAGKRVTVLYLLPEGFEVSEDENGYVIIVRSGGDVQEEKDAPKEEVNADDIPF